jgi:hypothetical protein
MRVSQRIEKICANCGNAFKVLPSLKDQKCCKPKCNHELNRSKPIIRPCGTCGKIMELDAAHKTKKYCDNKECRSAGQAIKTSMEPIIRKCLSCGDDFIIRFQSHLRKKYCRKDCSSRGLLKKETRQCRHCGIDFSVTRSSARQFHSYSCYDLHRQTNWEEFDHPVGYRRMESGYWRLKIGYNEWVDEHRYIVEKNIGRKLLTEEHVHHRNGNKIDNRIENLEIMSHLEHQKLHYEAELIGLRVLCGELKVVEV